MPHCTKCGEEIPEDAAFCPECGVPVAVRHPKEKVVHIVGGPPKGERVVYQAPSQMHCDYCGSRILDIDKTGKCVVPKCKKVVCEKCARTYKDGRVYCPVHYPKCFIATACYGSALEAPVKFLREFRDNEVMNTKIGKQFMRGFNKVYYSFSPTVARFIERHRYARVFIRTLFVAPLIWILKLSERVTHPIHNKEARIFATGALTTSMIFLTFYLIASLLRLIF
jgi:predicted RNA-binding Zn-ribbon protein involved in translation (DUF1610 family)